MMRTCDGSDASLVGKDGEPCKCGRTFNDSYRLVYFPHQRFEDLSADEMQKLTDDYTEFVKKEYKSAGAGFGSPETDGDSDG